MYSFETGEGVRLHLNESRFSHHPAVARALAAPVDARRYPAYPSRLEGALRARANTQVSQRSGAEPGSPAPDVDAFVTPGSDEALRHVLQYARRRGLSDVIVGVPGYTHFSMFAEQEGFRLREYAIGLRTTRADHLRLLRGHARLLARGAVAYIGSPNNPTGDTWRAETVATLADEFPKSVFIVDGAYAEYSAGPAGPDGFDELAGSSFCAAPNVFTTRTFSKLYGLAALRIGYVVGPPGPLAEMRARQSPKAYHCLAEEAALACLGAERYYFALSECVALLQRLHVEALVCARNGDTPSDTYNEALTYIESVLDSLARDSGDADIGSGYWADMGGDTMSNDTPSNDTMSNDTMSNDTPSGDTPGDEKLTNLIHRLCTDCQCLTDPSVVCTPANFVLFHVGDSAAFAAAVAAAGVHVRDRGALPGLEGFVRVTIGAPADCRALYEAAAAYFKNCQPAPQIQRYHVSKGRIAQMQELLRATLEALEGCVECWLQGGTLLGALRHGGFIPWDDDIDLAYAADGQADPLARADVQAAIRNAGLTLQRSRLDTYWQVGTHKPGEPLSEVHADLFMYLPGPERYVLCDARFAAEAPGTDHCNTSYARDELYPLRAVELPAMLADSTARLLVPAASDAALERALGPDYRRVARIRVADADAGFVECTPARFEPA